MNEVMVSIIVPTYNHEKYIEKALDSILMQKTNYSYEVLVGEDKSTDGTRAVLEEYERRHPEKIKVFYREQNMRTKELGNGADLRRRASGKYIVCLEGDDFWISEDKIEKQVAFLEDHPQYIAVSHNCVVVGENGEKLDEDYPNCREEEYALKHFLCGIYPGQIATIMSRNFITDHLFDVSILEKHLLPGDKLLSFALVTNGKVKCMQEVMTAYRHVRKGGSSYSANYIYDFNKDEHWHTELLDFARNQNKGDKCVEALYLGCLIHALKKKQLDLKGFMQYIKKIRHKPTALALLVFRMANIHLLKRGQSN